MYEALRSRLVTSVCGLQQLRRQQLGSRVGELLVRRGGGSLLVYEALSSYVGNDSGVE